MGPRARSSEEKLQPQQRKKLQWWITRLKQDVRDRARVTLRSRRDSPCHVPGNGSNRGPSLDTDAIARSGGTVDKKAKKKVLQMIPYGAYVVGTKTPEGKDHLMFGTWLMQTSFKPALVAFALSEDSRTLANVRRSMR